MDKAVMDLAPLHAKLKIQGGHFNDELIEQSMSLKYITASDKVLELGGNIGRNSMIIASILEDPRNLVVLESDPNSANILKSNAQLNNLPFHVVSAALSAQPLIQQGWVSKPGTSEPGWYPVATMPWETLKSLFPLDFTVLVADCEGALHPILHSYPQVLDGIRLVLLENDFQTKEEAIWVHDLLRAQGFREVYSTTCPIAWGHCKDFFWQAWSR